MRSSSTASTRSTACPASRSRTSAAWRRPPASASSRSATSRTPAMPPSIAGFLTKKPGICLTVSAPGFLNGLTALAHATTNCFPMILISGSSEREIVDLQQGDYEEMDQLAIAKPLCKAAFRVLHAADIGIGVARAIRAAVSGRPGGVYLDLPAKLFGQVMDAEAGQEVAGQGDRCGAGADPGAGRGQARARCAEKRQAPADHPRQGRGLRAGRRRDPRAGREERRSVPADEHGQGPAARHASAMRGRGALDGAEGLRRRHADRRAAQLAACRTARARPGARRRRSSSRSTSSRRRWTRTSRSSRRWSATSAPASSALLEGMGGNWPAAAGRLGVSRRQEARGERRQDGAAADEQQRADGLPRRARRAAHHRQGAAGRHPGQRRRQHARSRARHHRHVSAAQAPRRRHLGRHGHRHGLRHRRGDRDRQAGARGRRRLGLRLLRHGGRDDLPLQAAGLHRHLQQRRHLSRHRRQYRQAPTRRRPSSSRARATTR